MRFLVKIEKKGEGLKQKQYYWRQHLVILTDVPALNFQISSVLSFVERSLDGCATEGT